MPGSTLPAGYASEQIFVILDTFTLMILLRVFRQYSRIRLNCPLDAVLSIARYAGHEVRLRCALFTVANLVQCLWIDWQLYPEWITYALEGIQFTL